MLKYFDFEKEIELIDQNISENANNSNNLNDKNLLNQKKIKVLKKIYASLNPWQKVQVARHPDRPHSLDYIKNIFTDYRKLFYIISSIVTGLLTIGPRFGGAIDGAAKYFKQGLEQQMTPNGFVSYI